MPQGGSTSCSLVVWWAMVTVPPKGIDGEGDEGGTSERYGASRYRRLSARAGRKASLKKTLMPSARDCSNPKGPARLGPLRFCM